MVKFITIACKICLAVLNLQNGTAGFRITDVCVDQMVCRVMKIST